MNTKGFMLLIVTVLVIGGSVGGAFAGGLALGRSQGDDAAPETAFLQQFGGGEFSFEDLADRFRQAGGAPGGQLGGASADGLRLRPDGEPRTGQDAPSGFGGGTFGGGLFGGRTGFGGILNGTVGTVDGNVFTVTTDSGETQVSLNDDSTIQVYEEGAPGDLSPGDRVLVILSGDTEGGEPAAALSVVVNAPEGGGIFGGGGFGGRPRGP